jgi:glyoxylase-like metal-dependent hydrolase (beta-lactamase superfamily II)
MIKITKIGNVTQIRMARTLLGRGLYYTSAYFIDGLMIDTGCRHTVREFTQAVRDCNLRVEQVVNTHSHEDHIAGNAYLQKRFRVPVYAHPLALNFLENPNRIRLRPYQRIMWGRPRPSKGEAIGEVITTQNHRFQVIHAPGHSPDHVCLFEPDHGYLFTGDAFIGGHDKALRQDYNICEIAESLRKLAALNPGTIFPGSGSIKNNAQQEIQSKIEYLEATGARVRNLRAQGLPYHRIRSELFGPEQFVAYFTLGHFSGRHLVRSFVEDF